MKGDGRPFFELRRWIAARLFRVSVIPCVAMTSPTWLVCVDGEPVRWVEFPDVDARES